jgi:glyoxylase-like metal-dependent hydrolase (beta-lactamase superfamily II)
MKLYVMYNGLADDFPREAMARTGAPLDPSDCVRIPTATYLIEHADGYVLYDTGWTSRQPLTFPMPDEMRVTETLARIGVQPGQIGHLILSHLHLDHAGCLEPFAGAEFIVSKAEFENVASLLLQNKVGPPYVEADVRAWSQAGYRWRLIDAEQAVVDFLPGIRLVALGAGHAYGILALLVELPKSGNILLASDAIYGAVNLGPPLCPPGVIMDEDGWRRSADFLLRTAEKYGAQLWFGHDLAQFETLVKADEGHYE